MACPAVGAGRSPSGVSVCDRRARAARRRWSQDASPDRPSRFRSRHSRAPCGPGPAPGALAGRGRVGRRHHRRTGGGHRQPLGHARRPGGPAGHRPHRAADPAGPGDQRRRHPSAHARRRADQERRPGRDHLAQPPRRQHGPDRGADRRGEGQRPLIHRHGLRLRQPDHRRRLAYRGAARAAIHALRQRGHRRGGQLHHRRRHPPAAGRRAGGGRLLRHGLCARRRSAARTGRRPSGSGAYYNSTDSVSAFDRAFGGREDDGFHTAGASGRFTYAFTPDVQFDERAYYTWSRNEFDGEDFNTGQPRHGL